MARASSKASAVKTDTSGSLAKQAGLLDTKKRRPPGGAQPAEVAALTREVKRRAVGEAPEAALPASRGASSRESASVLRPAAALTQEVKRRAMGEAPEAARSASRGTSSRESASVPGPTASGGPSGAGLPGGMNPERRADGASKATAASTQAVKSGADAARTSRRPSTTSSARAVTPSAAASAAQRPPTTSSARAVTPSAAASAAQRPPTTSSARAVTNGAGASQRPPTTSSARAVTPSADASRAAASASQRPPTTSSARAVIPSADASRAAASASQRPPTTASARAVTSGPDAPQRPVSAPATLATASRPGADAVLSRAGALASLQRAPALPDRASGWPTRVPSTDPRRRFPRASIKVRARLSLADDPARVFEASLPTVNVSVGGLFLESSYFLELGTRLLVHLELPPHGRVVQVKAEVVLATHFLSPVLKEFITTYAKQHRFDASAEYIAHTADVLAAWELAKAELGGDVWSLTSLS